MSRYDYAINLGMFQGNSFEVLTITTGVATAFTTSVYDNQCMRALLTLESGSCRYRYDGTAPTTTVGHLVNSGDVIGVLSYKNMSAFKIISVSGTATAMITYEKELR